MPKGDETRVSSKQPRISNQTSHSDVATIRGLRNRCSDIASETTATATVSQTSNSPSATAYWSYLSSPESNW
ncbi:MAG: hypothetical protein J07HR59_00859 [Halorubrum sp. J07HR59]|nr:MAG: hypothetical protein J07HR59_00859 [Halorubrum sp. J07HR59]